MGRYRKQPVEIEAALWDGSDSAFYEVTGLAGGHDYTFLNRAGNLQVYNTSDSQWLEVPVGHWVIQGVHGEVYPCHPEIFDETYEPVEAR